jgi:hypothetical protein
VDGAIADLILALGDKAMRLSAATDATLTPLADDPDFQTLVADPTT